MTRAQYRTRVDRLEKWQLITTRTTNKGTIAKLISPLVFDINQTAKDQPENHQAHHRKSSEEPSENHQKTDREPLTNKETRKEGDNEIMKNAVDRRKHAALNWRVSRSYVSRCVNHRGCPRGVNLSVGYEFDPEMFACGQSPICAEVNRLVQSGVVVVAAAGNTGFGTVAASVRPTKVGLSNTINDPGNAELAITVGATHRDAPYTYGVSYFSSKGPTGDGRVKPDVVAPGERITSCGAGRRLKKATDSLGLPANDGSACYMEDSGTSMAAPHVSGAIAAFLSIRREFIGKPLDVERIFLSTASPLGRERYFEGHGLIDLIRAIQSV